MLSAGRATEPLALVIVIEGLQMQVTPEVRKTMRAVVASMRRHNPASRVGLMLSQGPAPPAMYRIGEAEVDLEREISRFIGSQAPPLLESILVATTSLEAEQSSRRVVLALAAGDSSNHDVGAPSRVLRALRRSGVSLWALDMGWGAQALGLSEERILAEAAQFSGGKREFSRSMVLSDTAARMLDVVHSQYVVTYRMPENTSAKSTLRVVAGRDVAVVLAPTWVPGR